MVEAEKKSRDELMSKVCPICGECTGQPDFVGHLPVLRCSRCGPSLVDPSGIDKGRFIKITEPQLMELWELYALAAAARNDDFMGPAN
jgi:hypothetical protein